MLEIRDLRVSYGEIAAVRGLSLTVKTGEIVAITGANGAGKSSTLNVVAGMIRPASGSICFQDEKLTGRAPHDFVRRGIVQVPEGRMVFGTLSVLENLQVGAYRLGSFLLNDDGLEYVLNQFPMLADRLHAPASSLSGGEAQMLALARGLMAKPRLLLLDEPTLGLSPIAAEEILTLVQALRENGLTILIVEQNVQQTLSIADRGYLLESGQIALEGLAGALLKDDRLVSKYLGITGAA